MKIRVNIDIEVGRLVKFFVLSDFFLLAGWGFIDPVFSVFIIQRIAGGTLITVGIAAAIYWILKSIIQIPTSNFLDRTPGEKDDFTALIAGLFLAGVSAAAFAWVTTAWQLYAVEAIHAVAFALYAASWPPIFSRHIDKDRMSFDWSLDSVAAGISAGITGLLGGIVAAVWGYTAVFFAGSALSFIAAFIILAMPEIVLPKPNRGAAPILEHKDPEMGI